MSKKKFNLIGGPFQHAITSTLWKTSKNIEWEFNSKNNDTSFYVDKEVFLALQDKDDGRKKYGWLLESRSIVPGLVEQVIEHKEVLLEVYEAIFTHDQRLLSLDDKFKWCPAYGSYIDEPKIHEKTKLVSMVTSNKNLTPLHALRNSLANKWKDSLDLYGRGYQEIDKKEEGLTPYMFSIAIENDIYETYFTEKIIDCFATGTIPVYLGPPNVGDHFNSDGIIYLTEDFDLNDLSEELYISKKEAIQDNYQRALEYDVLEDWIYGRYFSDK
jgi:hypothetical protein|tara:strand:+ start:8698 stop:9510 length:813 start_codon:yes stop_codon:yes gene_type:complete